MKNLNFRWRSILDYFNKKNPFFAKLSGQSTENIRRYTGTFDSKFGTWPRITIWVHEQHLETIDGLKKEVAILEKERPEGHDYVECDCSTCMALRELKTGIVI